MTDNELWMDGMKALYNAATPSADFEKLINECVRHIDSEGKVQYSAVPLTEEECAIRCWRKDINYMNYELDEETYQNIVESKIKEHNLSDIKATAFKNSMYYTCGPLIVKKK